jgi:Raf kinase inhibitor-like YbhB/YbcL family protein
MSLKAVQLTLQSDAFADGTPIPRRHSNYGESISVPLRWSEPPEGTQEFALIMDDPDSPLLSRPFVHWIIYKIGADVRELPEGLPKDQLITHPIRALQGLNSMGSIGYKGPMPPPLHGVHHYHFRLYALDEPLKVGPGIDKPTLLRAMEGHILAEGLLIGTYQK